MDLDLAFAQFLATRDPAALELVFERSARWLLRRARALTGDDALAEDLVQETFLVVLHGAPRFETGRACLPYLLGILVRRARRARVRATRELPRNGNGDAALAAHELAAAREARDVVLGALHGLPAVYRDVLEPFLAAGATPQQIGRQLGRAPATVRVQIHRGLRLLRAALPPGLGLLWLAAAASASPRSPRCRPVPAARRAPRCPARRPAPPSSTSGRAPCACTCAGPTPRPPPRSARFCCSFRVVTRTSTACAA